MLASLVEIRFESHLYNADTMFYYFRTAVETITRDWLIFIAYATRSVAF